MRGEGEVESFASDGHVIIRCTTCRTTVLRRSWVRIPAGPRIFSVDYSLSPKHAELHFSIHAMYQPYWRFP